ncbi:MAG: LacI family DNA-binding transcriptional regulator [Verrucomicrobia bacterium]|nr:LacI family DNA-binding transcriptional regulator [Verrucomicrobiota bacterium]
MTALPRVTQRDLARLARVSHTTVSLALRDHPSIPAATRDRIHALARRHHYRPDPMLSALNAYRVNRRPSRFQGTLAWLTSFETRAAWRGMIQAEGYFLGAREQAERLGYQLDEFWIGDPTLSARRATEVLRSRGVRGLIVAPLPVAHGRLALAWEYFSAVALGYSLADPQLHVVMNHQFRNMRHLVHHLHRLGYRRIGFAMPATTDERVDHNYLGGFWVAQQELPTDRARLERLLAPAFSADVFLTWNRRVRPDAVVTSASRAHDVIAWLEADGRRVPRDVGVAVASIPFGDRTVSGMDENVRAVGAMAVDTVVGMIHRNETGVPATPWRILAEGTWFQGRTVIPRRRKPDAA